LTKLVIEHKNISSILKQFTVNILRSILHACVVTALMFSSVASHLPAAERDGQTKNARKSCCHQVCPCAQKPVAPAKPMPAAPASEGRSQFVTVYALPLAVEMAFEPVAQLTASHGNCFLREQATACQTRVPLHLRIGVFLI
jgi:hypothetical protein